MVRLILATLVCAPLSVAAKDPLGPLIAQMPEDTGFAIAVGHVDRWVQTAVDYGRLAPEAQHGWFLDDNARKAKLGFDPATASGWASIGVDAAQGLAVYVPPPQRGKPVFLAKVTDRGKLTAFVERHGESWDPKTGTLTMDGQSYRLSSTGGLTAFHDPGTKLSSGLAGVANFQAATKKRGAADLLVYADPAHMFSGAPFVPAVKERLRAVAFYQSARPLRGGMTLLLGPVGRKAFDDLFVIDSPPPKFSRLAGAKTAGGRISLDFANLLEAVALVPDPRAQAQLRQQATMLPVVLGTDLPGLARAFTGHVGFFGSEPKDVLLAAQVKDAAAAWGLVQAWANTMGTAKRTGDIIDIQGPQPFRFELVDGFMLFGSPDRVMAARKATGAPPAVAKVLDGDAFLGVAGKAAEVASSAQLAPVKGLLPDVFAEELRLVDDRLEADGTLLMIAAVGIVAAVAIPAFMKYIRRAKTSEATMNVRKLYDGAVMYHAEHGKLPPSAPLTPAKPACQQGKSVKHAPNARDWAHPTWKALFFEIRDPHYYQYELISDGKSFTARAVGDLDCNGVSSTFERVGTLKDGEISGGAGLSRFKELE